MENAGGTGRSFGFDRDQDRDIATVHRPGNIGALAPANHHRPNALAANSKEKRPAKSLQY
jgi:hypothetical protein